ncbi:hypothetical protein CBG55_07700 [Prevotella intermedia]|jgi:hypothetical protein|nr:hypothetical protein CBG55_07700 [Prevotella intermedia]DAN58807.1 MAG TPA: YopX protein [Caudoviricetes sp.]
MTMNREILFRGKNPNGEWVSGDLILVIEEEPHIFYKTQEDIINERISNETVVKETVGQYTGLTDKNGNKIFEGDILHLTIPDGSIRHFVVEWANESRTLKPLNGFRHDSNPIRISGWCFNWEGHRLYPSVIDGVPDNERMEIVGNIHDNPELLKG